MRIFKYHYFQKWAKREKLSDHLLLQILNEIENGNFEANLGAGLYKKELHEEAKGSREALEQLLHLRERIELFSCMVLQKKIMKILA